MIKKISLTVLPILFLTCTIFAQSKTVAVTGTNVGNIAPEIALNGTDGKVVKLSASKGYLVLVDFWASWCGPCRRENPKVVEAYNTYSKLKIKDAKGFRVFSVSLDRDAASWKAAIEADHLAWKYHVSDLKMWDCQAAKDYKVYSIPSNVLIDANGVIVAKNLRGESLLLELEKWVKY